ncbi:MULTISPECIES: DUF5709 domain-containing protein [Kitasatospora]|uniref:DUF5709 domain-containing protein n=1 Tax=Kitasatospora setae (strain ATCC 33774 / DSM 43861 / JCM 3304 / KCC A-0304 / NBRC 14216 / KM-6054) TaxID=452652 RepID=E4N665_KITSK|nr:DUF5709 domain-containing protein [Kitasatospora setae]BAJ26696.1 hypothetical protein KSE_08590 [Kitasatospora setae KM-6054]
MTDPDAQDPLPAEDDGVLDPADSLETDDLDDDPLETGIVTADGYRGATEYGTTAAEAATGESLDRLLAEEEPDTPAPDVDDRWSGGPGPRAGRLVEAGTDLFAEDGGADGGAAGAEEAAVHLTDEDADEAAEFDDGDDEESLADALRFTAADDLRDADPDAGDDYR